MGQEVSDSQFDPSDFVEFARRVEQETRLLDEWERSGRMRDVGLRLGYELEGWLIDAQGQPAPRNQDFLRQVADPMVVPELARFNFEINDRPVDVAGGMFEQMRSSLLARWQHCEEAARALDLQALSIGSLPTLHTQALSLDNISGLTRYHALNEQVLRLRQGRPIEVDIAGVEHLQHRHPDVMLEAATTSLQIHLQVGSEQAVRAYNCSKMVSCATVAVGANSPYFLGKQLWAETRIPLFEQSIAVGASDYSQRVTFGVRYAEESILECFEANRDRYPVLLPDLLDTPLEQLAHLRLHNGTIWRWNRPLVGFDAAGNPHYRIEHRVIGAGTSALDIVADTAFYLGMMFGLMDSPENAPQSLPFDLARQNFYRAARDGLEAQVVWSGGQTGKVRELILQQLLPLAARGLQSVGIPAQESSEWLEIIAQRTHSGQTGAAWQTQWVEQHGPDWQGLVLAYAEHQARGKPVHRWN